MSSFPPRLEQFLTDLRELGDREEQMQLLIETAERFSPVPERVAKRPFSREHLVPGCESEAYIWAEELPGNTYKFHFAVENPQGISAKAMAVILDETLSGQPLESISAVPQEIVFDIFGRDLSMGKGQGLMSMLGSLKALAKAKR